MDEEVPLNEIDDLEDNFICDDKVCRWKLRGNSLTWIFTQEKSKYKPLLTIDVKDIVTIRSVKNDHYFLKNEHHIKRKSNHNNPAAVLDVSTLKNCNSLEIHYAKHKESKVSIEKVLLCHADSSTVIKWIEVVKQRINNSTSRPKDLLVFLNPYGGNKKAPQIYDKIVKPLFALAEINIDLITTEYMNHARDILIEKGWKNYDGVVCVGGDGTFSEVINGIVKRLAKETNLDSDDPHCAIPISDLKVGIIPAGSTDTVVYSLHGTSDVVTAAFHIICGDFIKSDVCSVHDGNNYLCCFISLMSYGYLGDVIKHSTSLRCLGPKRYDLAGAINFVFHQSYEGTVSFLRDYSDQSEDLIVCKKNDCFCNTDYSNSDDDNTKWEHIRGKFFMVTAANISCSCGRSPNGISPFGHFGDGYLNLVLIRRVTFLKKIKLLFTLSNKNRYVNELNFVEMHKTRSFKFETGYGSGVIPATKISSWNVDGELITIPQLQVRCHQQVIRLFCRRKMDQHSTDLMRK